MSEQPYDPASDTDADPGTLNPRDDRSDDRSGPDDPDADPAMLNPRDTTASTPGPAHHDSDV
ncbi:hypothetical protein [Sanguibacter sp. 25GB23B1]|uniref:hypothetical protein n=1 Tax=unclassified Sanguibacter TaxID=2645534 RepID=UPI0032AF7EF4